MEFDVIVLGTGAAGMVAAMAAHDDGAKVGLFEKNSLVGGTTAMSGGKIWMPNNPHMAEAGVPDSREEALTYLGSLSLGMTDPHMVETLIDTGPELVRWLEASTPLRLRVVQGYPDYHPEHPGGKPGGGRTLEPAPFSYAQLGQWATRVVPAGGTALLLGEDPAADERKSGQALAAALLKGCLDRGIVPITEAPAIELLREEGRIVGVRFRRADQAFDAAARCGVVLATGGFEWDADLVRTFLRGPMNAPTSLPSCTGDGLKMAMAVGASLGNMREAWWVPTFLVEGDKQHGQPMARLVLRQRTLPGSIMVNRRGRRFANEAANYNALGAAFHEFDINRFEYANIPAWLIFDHEYLQTYGFDAKPPGEIAPDWVISAPSLAELAARIDAPADALEASVKRWNENVRNGSDQDFGRGDSAYDVWWGDRSKFSGRHATLGPLQKAPYYAVQVHSGALGTKGGPRTDAQGRVLDHGGQIIRGLYACGNAMAGVTGMVYGGAGGTLGPAMVFGYLAGRDAARQRLRNARSIAEATS